VLDANVVILAPVLIANVVEKPSLLLLSRKLRDAAAPRNLAALFNIFSLCVKFIEIDLIY